ncbi:MAG: GNAT family N-acetyltransferase [Saprospiraceae bacterium]|nr:GNAT family N-acetyltransferase [Saprospiraceae bacterium]
MEHVFMRIAIHSDIPEIWTIIKDAIERRRIEGSKQWQDGYPNKETILSDIENGYGQVLQLNDKIITYAAVITEKDPDYLYIEGSWLNDDAYTVIHRVATASQVIGKGYATLIFQLIEKYCIDKGIFNIRVDTNFDNLSMLKVFEKLNYQYCGKVYLRGAPRRAYHKILSL